MELEITKFRFFLIVLVLLSLAFSVFIIGQPIVGHPASDYIGFYITTALPNLTSAKLQNWDNLDPIDNVDFADNAFNASKFPNSIITGAHVTNDSLTEVDFASLGFNDIQSVLWSAVLSAPNIEYAVVGFNVTRYILCNHPLYAGMQNLTPHARDAYTIFNDRVSLRYNWTSSNASGCGANPNGNITEDVCHVYYQGSLGFTGCDCTIVNEGVDTCT